MKNLPFKEIEPRDLGTRLQEARKAAGLTQADVAEQLEIARTTLVAIEKGERKVDPHELIQMAKLYGRQVSEIVGRPQFTDSFVPQFRARQKKDSAELDAENCAQELEQLAEDYRTLEEICHTPLPKNYPSPYEVSGLTPEDAGEDISLRERNRLGLGDGPLYDLQERLETDVGLRIFTFPMPGSLAGLFAYNDILGGCIGLNAHHPRERRNWSLAHEFGHFLTSRYQPEATPLRSRRSTSFRERLAESFAKGFVMPAAGLTRRFTEIGRANQGKITLVDLLNLAHTYQVSVQAMLLRLEELKKLPSGTWDRLKGEGFKPQDARRQLGMKETPDERRLLPKRYIYLVACAWELGEISEGQAARFLRTDRVTAREIIRSVEQEFDEQEDSGFRQMDVNLGFSVS
jgi:Zn-dependent peptidase ImmA (M78 family)/DNA-binding XRE family transcriptional regulator